MKTDGKKIQKARQNADLSTTQLGAAIEVSSRTVERWEGRESVKLNVHVAKAIASACGVKLEDIAKG